MDAATATLKRPSVAQVQVEIDVLKPRPDKIWIQMGSQEGYWQRVVYEKVPSYCNHCWHVGHADEDCHAHQPTFKSAATRKDAVPRKDVASVGKSAATRQAAPKQVYVAKTTVLPDGSIQHQAATSTQTPETQVPEPPVQATSILEPEQSPVLETSEGLFDVPIGPLVSKEVGFPSQPVIEVAESDSEDDLFSPLEQNFDFRAVDDLQLRQKATFQTLSASKNILTLFLPFHIMDTVYLMFGGVKSEFDLCLSP